MHACRVWHACAFYVGLAWATALALPLLVYVTTRGSGAARPPSRLESQSVLKVTSD